MGSVPDSSCLLDMPSLFFTSLPLPSPPPTHFSSTSSSSSSSSFSSSSLSSSLLLPVSVSFLLLSLSLSVSSPVSLSFLLRTGSGPQLGHHFRAGLYGEKFAKQTHWARKCALGRKTDSSRPRAMKASYNWGATSGWRSQGDKKHDVWAGDALGTGQF